MLVKCICTNCAGHLEFEEENAGESIDCPHCGFKTTLFLPGSEEEAELAGRVRQREFRKRLICLVSGLVLVGGIGYAVYHWGVPWVQSVVPGVESTLGALLVLALFCFMLPFAVVWLVFPVIVFFQFRKMTQVLEQLVERSQPTAVDEEADDMLSTTDDSQAELAKAARVEV
jgi:hypothetical protein